MRCGACARMFRDAVRHAEVERHGRRLERGSNIGRDQDAGGVAPDGRIAAQMGARRRGEGTCQVQRLERLRPRLAQGANERLTHAPRDAENRDSRHGAASAA